MKKLLISTCSFWALAGCNSSFSLIQGDEVKNPPVAPVLSPTIEYPLEGMNFLSSQTKLHGICAATSVLNISENDNSQVSNLNCTDGTYSVDLTLSGSGSRTLHVKQTLGSDVQTKDITVFKASPCTLSTATPGALLTTLDANTMPVKTFDDTGLGNPQAWDGAFLFGFNSTNHQDVTFPTTGYYKFEVDARYYSGYVTPPTNPHPKVQIAVDGRIAAEWDINTNSLAAYSSTNPSAEVEAFQVTAGVHRVSVSAGNWNKEVGLSNYQVAFVKNIRIYPLTHTCESLPAETDVSNETLRKIATLRNFKIGSVLDTGLSIGSLNLNVFHDDPLNPPYLKKQFNHINPGSVFLMDRVAVAEGAMDFSKADEVVAFAVANNQSINLGHLVWHHYIPAWLITKNDPAFTRQFLKIYIQTVMNRYKDRVKYWVVVNEPLDDNEGFRTSSFWYQQYETLLGAGHGKDYIAEAFNAAHQADPTATLILNDYSIDELGRKSDAAYKLTQELLAQNVPVNAIGLQGHLKLSEPVFYKSMKANLDRFAALGIKIHFTELDVGFTHNAPTPIDLSVQAQYYRNTLKVCLRTPACEAYTIFGTLDKYWWGQLLTPTLYKGSILFDDYSRKPGYEALLKLLYGVDPL